jgi:acyl dehydratase
MARSLAELRSTHNPWSAAGACGRALRILAQDLSFAAGALPRRPEEFRMSFTAPIDQRWFEDYQPGTTHELGGTVVTEEEILEFARRFDPQSFHVDREAAAHSQFGGLIASGWHTGSLMMRILVDHFISHNASLGSPGMDEIRWLKPVRPGDTLRVRATVLEAKRSRSKPDRGVVRARFEVRNQHDDVVMTATALGMYLCRPA